MRFFRCLLAGSQKIGVNEKGGGGKSFLGSFHDGGVQLNVQGCFQQLFTGLVRCKRYAIVGSVRCQKTATRNFSVASVRRQVLVEIVHRIFERIPSRKGLPHSKGAGTGNAMKNPEFGPC